LFSSGAFFGESEKEKQMYPNLRVIYDSEKPVRCVFNTLVVKTQSLKKKYEGGLAAFVNRYQPQCCKGLAVLCAMGTEDLYEPIEDLERSGLVGQEDFACFDASSLALGVEVMRRLGHETPSDVKLPLTWLKGYARDGGVEVYLVECK